MYSPDKCSSVSYMRVACYLLHNQAYKRLLLSSRWRLIHPTQPRLSHIQKVLNRQPEMRMLTLQRLQVAEHRISLGWLKLIAVSLLEVDENEVSSG